MTPELFKSHLPYYQQADWVVVDSNLSEQSIQYLAESLSGYTQLLAIPVSKQKVKHFESAIKKLSGVILNRDELSGLSGLRLSEFSEIKQACLALLQKGCTWVIVTCGASGVFVAQGAQFHHLDQYREISPTDVTGAGDSFAAGVLFGLQKGSTLLEAVQWGIGCAQLTLQTEYSVHPDLSPVRLLKETQMSASRVQESER
jgi:pseudouridine kinase